jgi:hypothetical protein
VTPSNLSAAFPQRDSMGAKLSGRQDLNLRPPDPQSKGAEQYPTCSQRIFPRPGKIPSSLVVLRKTVSPTPEQVSR